MLNLVCLHGFWGQGSDWNSLLKQIFFQDQNVKSWCPELFVKGPLAPQNFKSWCERFSLEINKQQIHRPRVLLGYSMGGRLALHHLLAYPDFWDGAIIFSSHPGGLNSEEARHRQQWIADWVDKFRQLSTEELSQQWEAQEIFSINPKSVIKTTPPRELLIQALEQWSVLRHEFKVEDLKTIKTPLLWFFGEKDLKYIRLMENMKTFGIGGKFEVIPEVGHRIINDAPERLAPILTDFFKQNGWLTTRRMDV